MRDTPRSLIALDAKAPLVAYWVDVMNARKGDVLTLRIAGPDGKSLAEHAQAIDTPRGFLFTYIGRRLHAPLSAGNVHAQVTLVRDGKTILEEGKSVPVR